MKCDKFAQLKLLPSTINAKVDYNARKDALKLDMDITGRIGPIGLIGHFWKTKKIE